MGNGAAMIMAMYEEFELNWMYGVELKDNGL